ncbi:MFS transporter [Aeromicrobium fastidiosum]|uniref:MFS transporter n=1 Tax=Aeromicrobium fastidiosum TaxID=52699 RepID=UPI001D7F48EB|nr:MFS transporter [Aeromicrobium fastidiosum]MBP2389259.1 MFS family permease [Aeromicrobium fastidiosum]
MPPTRARIATSGVFALNGFLLGMWIVNIPTIKDRTGVDQADLGLMLLVLGGMAWIGMQLSGPAVDRFGSRPVAILATIALAATLPGPGFATSGGQLVAALAVVGFFNGFIDVAQNAQAVVVEREYRRPIMSAFHAFYSLGALLASILGGGLIALGVDVRTTLVVAAVIGVAAAAGVRPFLIPAPAPVEDAPAKGRAPWTSKVLLLGLLAFSLLLAEGVAYDWSTIHLRDSLGSSETIAAVAYGAFSAAMTIVRLLADRVVAAWGPAVYVSRAALVGALGLLGAALAPDAGLAIVAWAVFGVGLAGCVPQFFSAAGNVDPAASGTYLARVTSMGYVGLLAGPSVIGLLTHWIPLTTAFALPIVGCLAAGLLAPRALAPAPKERA